VSVLRIRAPLGDAPLRCDWTLAGGGAPVSGSGALADLPRGADRVQLVVPASHVLITRASVPKGARRHAGAALAFAVEELSASEPDANEVRWLGSAHGADALAVLDKRGLMRWREGLDAAGLREYEIHAEMLLLPLAIGEWSLAWNGTEGFVRSGEFEGAATDCGDTATPPLSLRLLLDEASARGARPSAIAVYACEPGPAPDAAQWQAALGVPLRSAGTWDWRTAHGPAGSGLPQDRRGWRLAPSTVARLRPAAWLAGGVLALHAAFLVADWTMLAAEQLGLRARMEARFRAVFPDAVAVADPALQMRRQLAAARHRAGAPDGGDFAPMLDKVAAGLSGLPAGTLRIVSYEGGRMTLELAPLEEAEWRRTIARLIQAGLVAERSGAKLITVRAP